MEYIILILKGMLVGVANIIPGVSGGTLLITLGLYEELINVISHFFQNLKKNLKFLLPIGIGMVLAILLLSKIISGCLDKYPFPTTMFFIGLILGGIPLLWNKAKAAKNKTSNWVIFFITFSIILTFAFLKDANYEVSLVSLTVFDYIKLFLIGMVSAATMVIPGISGSFVLMLLGYYVPIVNTIKNLTDFSMLGHNMLILIPFGLGILIGIILVSKFLEYLFKKYPIKTYYGVLGFVLASIVAIIMPILNVNPTLLEVVIAIILCFGGGMVAYKLGDR